MNAHELNIIYSGKDLDKAEKALIMLHGRGAKSEDILALAKYIKVEDFALLAPQAYNYSWYPLGFMANVEDNEPFLSSALEVLAQTVEIIENAGIKTENIYFLGFSQGACLTLEFLARNAKKYGGAVAYIGGLIGEKLIIENYKGNFEQMPILLFSSDPDFHVPVKRVHDSKNILESLNAAVSEHIYPNLGHIVTKEQLALTNMLIFK